MTIEQKSKAYDKALEIARKELQTCGSTDCDAARQIYRFFPELKESEDERIRKWIIGVLSTYEHNKDLRNAAISWLEKQGEQKDPCETCEEPRLNCQNFPCDRKKNFNSADKIEPKFKVGDWILIDKPCQVKSIDNYVNYAIQYSDSDFRERYVLSKNFCESYFHLWTINDAKDGDILVTENKNIFIFKSISDCTIYDYCGLYFGKFAENSSAVNGKVAVQLPTDHVPATKEQRDTLMKAMADAGYTFDFEKKELKEL